MAFSSAWKVAVQFNFQSAGAIQNLNQIGNATNQAAANMTRFGKVSQMTALLVGAAFMGAGRSILGFVGDSVKAAADLQSALTVLGVKEGNATGSQRAAMAAMLPQIAHETGRLSQIDAAKLAGSILGTGFTAEQLVSRANGKDSVLELFAKFGDALALGSAGGEHPETVSGAATSAASIAHQFGAYTAKEIGPMLEKINQVSQAMSVPMSSLVRQMMYFAPDVKAHKMTFQEVVDMLNIIGPMGGMQSKGGTGIDQVIRDMTMAPTLTRSLKLGRTQAFQLLGLSDSSNRLKYVDKNTGELDLKGALALLQRDHDTMNTNTFNKLISLAFPSANALRTIQALVDPDRKRQADLLAAKEGGVPTIDTIQARYLATLSGAWSQLTTDFKSLEAAMTPSFIGMITAFVQGLDRMVVSLTSLFNAVPWTATAATIALVATGLGLMAAGFMLVWNTLGMSAAVLASLTGAWAALTSPITLVVAGVIGLGLAFRAMMANPAQFGKNLVDFFELQLPHILTSIGSTIGGFVVRVFGGIGQALSDLLGFAVYKTTHWGSNTDFFAYTKTADPGLHRLMNPIVYAADRANQAAAREHARLAAKAAAEQAATATHKTPAGVVARANIANQKAWDAQVVAWGATLKHSETAAKAVVASFSHITDNTDFGPNGVIYQAALATNVAFTDVFHAVTKMFTKGALAMDVAGQGPAWHVPPAPPHQEKKHGTAATGKPGTQVTYTGDHKYYINGAQSPAATAAELQRQAEELRKRHLAMTPSGSH